MKLLCVTRGAGEPTGAGSRNDVSVAALITSLGHTAVLDDDGALATLERSFDSLGGHITGAYDSLSCEHLDDARPRTRASVTLSNRDPGQFGSLVWLLVDGLIPCCDLEGASIARSAC